MSGGGRVGSKCVRCEGLFITPQSRGKLCEECIDAEEREDIGTLRWFGESWGAPVCDPRAHVPTPVGWHCAGHEHMHPLDGEEIIKADDQGVTMPYYHGEVTMIAYHLDCWLHEVGADRISR